VDADAVTKICFSQSADTKYRYYLLICAEVANNLLPLQIYSNNNIKNDIVVVRFVRNNQHII
jgi:hypothetical protein